MELERNLPFSSLILANCPLFSLDSYINSELVLVLRTLSLWRVEKVQSDAFVLDLSLSGLSIAFIYRKFSLVMENPKLSLNQTTAPPSYQIWARSGVSK